MAGSDCWPRQAWARWDLQGLWPPLALPFLTLVLSRRKSKQALRDYKKVQIQLENLESSVRDRCKKEFTGEAAGGGGPGLSPGQLPATQDAHRLLCSTDLMTEMTDLTSDLLGSGIPFLDYKLYAERVFFPGHQESPLHRDLGVPESRRPTVEQGLGQLSNLLNSKLFLTKVQPRPWPRPWPRPRQRPHR